ncbi:MAG: TRAP transporter large permease [Desulfobacter sp.]|nr:TRAP transporter large permease [Desulfobacter sp.]WDP87045.1 MAG: TRAP transporter large permease [Desulfobacter sp.]
MIYVVPFFFILILAGIPIVYGIGLSGMLGLISGGGFEFLSIVPTRLLAGCSNYILVSIPLFILCSEFLNRSGMTDKLIDFALSLVGRFRGGLSHVNIGSSILFAGLTGTAVTDTAAIGNILIPTMKEKGYGAGYCAAVTAASSVIGPIIPPSLIMIVYASMFKEVSVISMFAAGIVPGIIVGLALFGISALISIRRNYPKEASYSLGQIFKAGKKAIWALLTPIIILTAILSGLTTVTEAGGIAALYALVVGRLVYKSLSLTQIYDSLVNTAVLSGVVFFLIGAANILGWVITYSGLTETIGNAMISFSPNPIVQLIMVNILFLVVGMFLDIGPAVVILAPIVTPVMTKLGFDPLHFAMIMMVNVNIGNATPPMGMSLMVGSQIAGVPYETAMKEVTWFLLAEISALLLISYVPALTLWVPTLLGLSWG